MLPNLKLDEKKIIYLLSSIRKNPSGTSIFTNLFNICWIEDDKNHQIIR